MDTSFFSFNDGEKKSSEKKIEFGYNKYGTRNGHYEFNQFSFLAKGVGKGDDPSRYWMSYIYPIEFEGNSFLASTNGRVLHYIPLADSSNKQMYEVEKLAKSEVSLKEFLASPEMKETAAAMTKVIPLKESCIEVPHFSVTDEKSVNREFIFSLITKLSGSSIYFKFEYIDNFVEHFCMNYFSCMVSIYAPKNKADKPWRLEHWERDGNQKKLIYGIVLAPALMFSQVLAAECLYSESEKEEKTEIETVSSNPIRENTEYEREPEEVTNDEPF